MQTLFRLFIFLLLPFAAALGCKSKPKPSQLGGSYRTELKKLRYVGKIPRVTHAAFKLMVNGQAHRGSLIPLVTTPDLRVSQVTGQKAMTFAYEEKKDAMVIKFKNPAFGVCKARVKDLREIVIPADCPALKGWVNEPVKLTKDRGSR